MKKLLATLIVLSALFGSLTAAQAQLVVIDKDYRVTRVDTVHNRLEVHNMNDQDLTLFVNCDGETRARTTRSNSMSWKSFRPGDVVEVKGGLGADGQIHGKELFLKSRS